MTKTATDRLECEAIIHIRQSTQAQLRNNSESRRRQCRLAEPDSGRRRRFEPQDRMPMNDSLTPN